MALRRIISSTSACTSSTAAVAATAAAATSSICCAEQTRAVHPGPRRKTNVRTQHNQHWFAKTKNHLLTGKESINTLDRPSFPGHAEDVDRPMVVPNDARCFACNKDVHSHSVMTDFVWIPSGNASIPTPHGYFFCKSCFRCTECKFRFMHNKFYTVKGKAVCVRCALGREVQVPTRRWHDSFVAGYSTSSRITGQAFPRYKHELEFLYNPEK